MENVTNNRHIPSDLRVGDFNSNTTESSKQLELLARWIPICQDIANDCGMDLPDPQHLQKMIFSANEALRLLAHVSLVFPDPITQDRIVNQFLIDCFAAA